MKSHIGESPKGIPVFIDRYAYEADGIIVVNRTNFHGGVPSDHKSGLFNHEFILVDQITKD